MAKKAEQAEKKDRRRGYRPNDYSDYKHKRIVELVGKGIGKNDAFASVGIVYRTAMLWLQKGRDHIARGEDSVYAKLAADVEKAEAKCLMDAYGKIDFKKDVTAWEWFKYLDQRAQKRDAVREQTDERRRERAEDAAREAGGPEAMANWTPPPFTLGGGLVRHDDGRICDEDGNVLNLDPDFDLDAEMKKRGADEEDA